MFNSFETIIGTIGTLCLMVLVYHEVTTLVTAALKSVTWPRDVRLSRPEGLPISENGTVQYREAYRVTRPEELITARQRVTMFLYSWLSKSLFTHEFHIARFGYKPGYTIKPYLAVALVGAVLALVCGESARMALNWALIGSFSTFASFEAKRFMAHVTARAESEAAVREMIAMVKAI